MKKEILFRVSMIVNPPRLLLQNAVCIPLIALLFAGLFLSRALLSVTSVLMIVVFFLKWRDAKDWKQILLATTLIVLPVFISGLWSENKTDWWRAVEVKVPLLTIALGICSATFSIRWWQKLSILFLLLISLGTLWSTWQYLQNSQIILQDYLRAKVLPTPLDDDHIRFSWLVVLGILLHFYIIPKQKTTWIKALMVLHVCWLAFYLHLLSAKTGLICFYIGAISITLYSLSGKRKLIAITALLILFILPITAYFTMPTFQNRIQYILYDFGNYSKGVFLPGSSDGARVLSIKAGWSIITQHPVTGVGFGDMKVAIDDWHNMHHPSSLIIERFLPLNEWFIYGAGSGWIGIGCFSLGLFLLLKILWKDGRVIERIAAVILIIPLITDDTLESQFGVFIFIFMLMWLCLYKKLNAVE